MKDKIANSSILSLSTHIDKPVIVVYSSKGAVSAALFQEHDGTYWLVTLTIRAIKQIKINYEIVEKEVLALRRILYICYFMFVLLEIKIFKRYSTLAW